MSGIALKRVSIELGGSVIVDRVDLEVAPGAWFGVIGPNGAGKTTLLRAIAGTLPHVGTIELDGRSTDAMSVRDRARLVAVVPQQPVLPRGMSVFDYVLLGRTAHIPVLGVEGPADRAIVVDVLGRLELADFAHRDLATLSGGETQRAVIARALAQQAPILLLDEPTTALDIGHQQQVLDLIDRLRRDNDLTVVSAMHDLTLAAQHADAFALLANGRIVAEGTAREVFRQELLEDTFAATVSVVEDDDGIVVLPRRAKSRA